uniref:DUF6598 domain-containing protein n=1 Tax=Aegilops tauschii TaxID=37682 RepID=R7WC33_AEGTA
MAGVSEEEQSELFNVVNEIMSLHRERRDLLAALTPGVSVWKRRGPGEETLVRRLAGTDHTAPVQVQAEEMEAESASTAEQLGRYFDSIVQDTGDLSHRMLSMAHAVVKPDNGAALSSYMADELVNSTSALMHACKELYDDTTDGNEQAAAEEHILGSLRQVPERALELRERVGVSGYQGGGGGRQKQRDRYEKLKEMGNVKEYELRWAKAKAKEKEEKKKREKDQEEENKKEEATMEYLKTGMEATGELFADYRFGWETGWGSKSVVHIRFLTDLALLFAEATLSPMHFTVYTPNTIPSSCGVTGSTLQIYSIRILELKRGLNWPLKLYGVVAARDTVDRNRNIVFSRSSRYSQELNEDGSSLCLTGPSRAIVALGPVDFEIELKIEEGEESQDKELITLSKRYDGTGTSLMFENSLCVAELKLKQLSEAVQATVLGVCVVEGDWPFEHGCRVACTLSAAADEVVADADEIVLLDCRGDDEEVRVGSDGYLHLSRSVVSVQKRGTLVVVIRTYLESGHAAQDSKVEFPAKLCQTSESECSVGNSKVKIVVAWSLLVKEKQDLLLDCPTVEP